MKKTVLVLLLLFAFCSSVFAILYSPPDVWLADGPGGKYGVFSYHSEYSFIVVADYDFEIPFCFKTTRILFVAVPCVLIGLFGIVIIKLIKMLSSKYIIADGKSIDDG
ncbi:MAG: hypothetical protein ACYTFY_08315 [Planctomycetota bacterium]|jgi:hypothetical protein